MPGASRRWLAVVVALLGVGVAVALLWPAEPPATGQLPVQAANAQPSAAPAVSTPATRRDRRLEGTVVDPAGQPVRGATVFIYASKDAAGTPLLCPGERPEPPFEADCEEAAAAVAKRSDDHTLDAEPLLSAITDASGGFSADVDSGRHDLLVEAATGWGLALDVEAGRPIEVALKPAASLAITVQEQARDQRPLAGARVIVALTRPLRSWTGTTAVDGTIAFTNLPEAEHHGVVAMHPGHYLPFLGTYSLASETEIDLEDAEEPVEGKVLHEGTPVAGARVYVERDSFSVSTRTDPQGRFRFARSVGWLDVVRAKQAGLAGRAVVQDGPVTVHLEKEGALRVEVVSAGSGERVRGAEIAVAGGEERFQEVEPGLFVLEGPPVRLLLLKVQAPGHAPESLPATLTSEVRTMRVTLGRGETLRGIVLDEGGRPLAGAAVTNVPAIVMHSPVARDRPSDATTDGEGRFALAGLPKGGHLIEVSAAGHALLHVGATVPRDGELVVRMRAAKPFVVEVVDDRGQAVPAAEVAVRGVAEQDRCPAGGVTGDDGRADLDACPPAAWTILPRKQGFADAPPVPFDSRKGAFVRVTLPRGLSISGRVVDDQGAPLDKVHVTCRRGRPGQGDFAYTGTDPSGAFALTGLADADYVVSAEALTRPFDDARTVARPGGKPLLLTLRRHAKEEEAAARGAVTGRVVREGRPALSFTVRRTRTMAEDDLHRFVSPDGRFLIEGLHPGKQELIVEGDFASRVIEVAVVGGRTADAGDVVVGAGGDVAGTVLDDAGKPVAGAQVRVSLQGALLSHDAATGPDGTFRVSNVAPGPATAEASRHREAFYDTLEPVPITVAAGQTTRVTLQFKEPGTLLVKVVDSAGRPAEDVTVDASAISVSTDGAGLADFSPLSPGTYEVEARDAFDDDERPLSERLRVQLKPKEKREVTLRLLRERAPRPRE